MCSIRTSQIAGSKFRVVLGAVGLALLGAGQVQAAPLPTARRVGPLPTCAMPTTTPAKTAATTYKS